MTSLAIFNGVSADAIFGGIIAILLSVGAAFFALMRKAVTTSETLRRIEGELRAAELPVLKSRLDQLWEDRTKRWDFLQQHGDAEAAVKGMAKKNSPLDITDSTSRNLILDAFEPLIPALEETARRKRLDATRDSDESALWRVIATEMTEEIADTVCPKLKTESGEWISLAGCVSLAIAVLRYLRAHHAVAA